MSKPLEHSKWTAGRRSKAARRYRSHCSTCLKAIYWDEAAEWRTDPMGLSHEECAA